MDETFGDLQLAQTSTINLWERVLRVVFQRVTI